jgi:hypothetical protein
MHPVKSSHIEAIGRSPEGDLVVKYLGRDKHYTHPAKISEEKFNAILNADSVGKAINAFTKEAQDIKPPISEDDICY